METLVGPSVPSPAHSQPVVLRVSDLVASRRFFEDLFGLQPAPHAPPTEDSVVLISPVPGHQHFCIRLTTGAVPIRLSGVHVELETTNDLLDLYFLALLGGYRTGELRFRRGSLSTTIADPDGHMVEVEAHHEASRFTLTMDRRPWRSEHAPAGRHAAGRSASRDDGAAPRPEAARPGRDAGDAPRASATERRFCSPPRTR